MTRDGDGRWAPVSLTTDIRNAGGNWVDEEVVTSDDGLVTRRQSEIAPARVLRGPSETADGYLKR